MLVSGRELCSEMKQVMDEYGSLEFLNPNLCRMDRAMGRDPVIARDSPGRGISALPGRVGACLMGVSSGIAPVWGYDSGSAALVWMLCLEVCASRFTRKRRHTGDAAFGFPVLLPATLSWSCGPWRSPTGRCVCCRQAGPF